MKTSRLFVGFAAVLMITIFLFSIGASISNTYDPWIDYNNDGKIGTADLTALAKAWGAAGAPLTKAYIAYDSGWLNITNQCGHNITITHNLNTTNMMVDIQGKTTINGGVHQTNLGLPSHQTGWNHSWSAFYNPAGGYSVVQTADGGYALTGFTGTTHWQGAFLTKTDRLGNTLWSKAYGSWYWGVQTYGYSLIQTSDGGYAIAGYADAIGYSGFWLLKTDSVGNAQWNKTYGGGLARSVVQTSDGGYAIAGYTGGPYYPPYSPGGHAYLVKTDSNGVMQWNQTCGGTGTDIAYSLVKTSDGGYAFAGYTDSFGAGGNDFWLVKTDTTGTMLWNRTYGGTGNDVAYGLVQSCEGGYALAGSTSSYGAGADDIWLVKTNAAGTTQWNKTYGGAWSDCAYSLVQTLDGGYVLAGCISPPSPSNLPDFYLAGTDSSGSMLWSDTNPPSWVGTYEYALSVIRTEDGGYAFAGRISAGDGAGIYLVKVGAESGLAWTNSTPSTITLYRGATDSYWNFVRVRIWAIKNP